MVRTDAGRARKLPAAGCQVLPGLVSESVAPLLVQGTQRLSIFVDKKDTPLPKLKQGSVSGCRRSVDFKVGVERFSSRLMQESRDRRNIFEGSVPASRIARLLNAVPKWLTVEDYRHAWKLGRGIFRNGFAVDVAGYRCR
jgi:hypothetical protein